MGVAPHAGVWIETVLVDEDIKVLVAPHAGVWIETEIAAKCRKIKKGRAPRGRVD